MIYLRPIAFFLVAAGMLGAASGIFLGFVFLTFCAITGICQ